MQLVFIFFISIIAILEFVVLQSLNKDFQKQKSLANVYKEKKNEETKKNFILEQQLEDLKIQLDKEIEQNKTTKKELTNAKRKITNLEKKIAKK